MAKVTRSAADIEAQTSAFDPRPTTTIDPYTVYGKALYMAGRVDDEEIAALRAKHGVAADSIAFIDEAGMDFEHVARRMTHLPAIVYAGGKEFPPGSPIARPAETFMVPFGLMCGMLRVSGIAGGGQSMMAVGQAGHKRGINAAARLWPEPELWKKCGVAGVHLAIAEEASNPHVTPGWAVRPTRNLDLRKGRLYSLGHPVAAVHFAGGDATLDEFAYVKTQTKPTLVRQLDTAFEFCQPAILMVEGEDWPFWSRFMDWYEFAMIHGQPERIKRKRAEVAELREGLITINGEPFEPALHALNRVRPVIACIYGNDPVDEWEFRSGLKFIDEAWYGYQRMMGKELKRRPRSAGKKASRETTGRKSSTRKKVGRKKAAAKKSPKKTGKRRGS